MPRPLRDQTPGECFHVTSRGNDGRKIYTGSRDRNQFLELLDGVVTRHRWRCLAYCLMGNHYHLVIKLTEANLAAGMHILNGVYARRFNRNHRCRGHLFERRYAAEHVERDAHLLEALRYSDLNPVRAGLCPHPVRWRWSSYRAVAGDVPPPRLLAFEDVLALFGDSLPNARRRYVRFVEEGLVVDRAWHRRSSPSVAP